MQKCCKWPDGTERIVIVVVEPTDQGMTRVAWNEQHDPMASQGCVCGLDAEVPKEWLRDVDDAEARKIEERYWNFNRKYDEPEDSADWWKAQG